ncbi:MAG: NYN domain-containing protein [Actinomycetes bacterium]
MTTDGTTDEQAAEAAVLGSVPSAQEADAEVLGSVPSSAPVLGELPDEIVAGYLEAALTVVRTADAAELPGALRGFATWAPRRLHSPRVLAMVKRGLETDPAFRAAVDQLVLSNERQLAELVRDGHWSEALASGEPPAAVAKVGLALGVQGSTAVDAALRRAEVDAAQATAAKSAAATAEVAAELTAARRRAEDEATAARAAREQARAGADELRRAERERRRLEGRVRELETALEEARAAADAAESRAATDRRRLTARIEEQRAMLEELQRANRALRRPSGVDPALAEAVGALERDLGALRRAAGLDAVRAPGAAAPGRGPERRTPLPVPGGRTADDPQTLLAWASEPGVLVLIDGYNVTKQPMGFPDHTLADQRTLLVARCRPLARRAGEVVIVFDGAEVGPLPTGRLAVRGVGVVFTDPDRIADDEIVARVNAEPPDRPVVVVSSDNEVRERVEALGANAVASPVLLAIEGAR